jgi:hypothetical protein
VIDEGVLTDLERERASPVRRKGHEDRTQDERLALMVANSLLLQAVPDLVAEVRRLRGWLRGMVEATQRVEEPCGWGVELQGWAVEALTGTAYDRAVVQGDERREETDGRDDR